MAATTPLRMLPPASATAVPDDVERDEILSRIAEVLDSTPDHRSWSDGIAARSGSLAEDLHLSPLRANVLRGLPLPEGATVLEVGAGAGAVTRHLGETSAAVDALEPDPALADLARRRCADLTSVVVHEVSLDRVPDEAAYDLVVALDPAGPSGDSLDDLLRRCVGLLRPGGLLVVAVESPATQPDELRPALQRAGLAAHVLRAHPDHRLTTALVDPAALEQLAPDLLQQVVRAPHEAEDVVRPASVVVIAGEQVPDVDPAVFWSSGRRADLSACNRVRPGAAGPVVVRDHAFPAAPRLGGPLTLVPQTEPYVPGTPLTDVLARAASPADAVPLLAAWFDLVRASPSKDGVVPWDLIPRNIQVTAGGSLRAIDQEWSREGTDPTMVLHRGTFWLAYDLLFARTTPWWLTGLTVLGAADLLMALTGEPVTSDWRERLFQHEAVSMAWVAPLQPLESIASRTRKEWRNMSQLGHESPSEDVLPPTDGSPATVETLQRAVQALSDANHELRSRVEQLELDRRNDEITSRDHAIGLRAKLETTRAELARAEAAAEVERQRSGAATRELAAARASTTWRVGRAVVSPVAAVKNRRTR